MIYGFVLLSRPVNLLMILFTCLAVKFWLMDKAVLSCPGSTELRLEFALLVTILVILTASGNIINDYFDVRVDRINKPNRVVIDKWVKRRVAIVWHFVLNALAIFLALYLGYLTQNILMVIVPFLLTLGIWFYSSAFKKKFLIGNVVVALMVSSVPLLVGWLYIFPMKSYFSQSMNLVDHCSPGLFNASMGVLLYTAFAFVLTLIREIQKDLEDAAGDSMADFKTLAIKLGSITTRRLLVVLMISTVISLTVIAILVFTNPGSSGWVWAVLAGFVIAPLLVSAWHNLTSGTHEAVAKSQRYTKLAMVGGLILLYFVN